MNEKEAREELNRRICALIDGVEAKVRSAKFEERGEDGEILQGEELEKIRANQNVFGVGGCVRDEQMSIIEGVEIVPKDIDVCVTGVSPEEFQILFPEAQKTGESFEVYRFYVPRPEDERTFSDVEMALAREEKKVGKGHKGFAARYSKQKTILDDLTRRDFTIGAMAKEWGTGKLIDPFGGVEDIKKKIVRAIFVPCGEKERGQAERTHSRRALEKGVVCKESFACGVFFKLRGRELFRSNFSEDPLRALRAFRFASRRKGWRIDPETKAMISAMKNEMPGISNERVYAELQKTMQGEEPSAFFREMREAGLMKREKAKPSKRAKLAGFGKKLAGTPAGRRENVHFNELAELAEQNPKAYAAAMAKIDALGKSAPEAHKFAALMNGLSPEAIERMGKRVRMPGNLIDMAKFLAKHRDFADGFDAWSDERVASFFEELKKHPLTKQAETANKKTGGSENPIGWFLEAAPSVLSFESEKLAKEAAELAASWREKLEAFRPEIPEGFKGPEIGKHLFGKKIELVSALRGEKSASL